MLDTKHTNSKNLIPPLKEMELSGSWKFREIGKDIWYQASVPGNNFSDLKNAGLIEDPFLGTNEKELQWIEKKSWEYYHEFRLEPEDMEFASALLILEGLDTYADVYLNDRLLLEADNMFVRWQASIQDLIREGTNMLHVHFHSPLHKVAEKARDVGFLYPAGNDHSEENLSVFTRKAPYHYGWDWGPRFVCSGIWRPVRIVFSQSGRMENIQLTQHLTEKNAEINATVEIDSVDAGRGCLMVSCLNQKIKSKSFPFNVIAGNNTISIDFRIENYKKWWPRPLGNPDLYELKFTLTINEETADEKIERIGLRKLEVINEPDDLGESFYFKVNDVPIFVKGANYIPRDSFLTEVTEKHHRQVFEDAVAANMNMLRVWGGGIYEEDVFYDLADQYGILIWQDFMFACTMYPGDDAFLASIRQEAIHNIKRLRNHPSVALWCGNNEIEVGWKHWGWQEEFNYTQEQRALLRRDYEKLFDELLPFLVRQYDPDRYYFPSSPISHFEDSGSFKIGDNHYWGVWHKEAPFEDFEVSVPRFMSEYGFQSFPILASVKKYAAPSDWTLESEAMLLHQKHPRGNQLIKQYLLRDYKEPKDFESFLYASQVLQAEGMKMGIEAHRRNKPFCMGTLYWQLNDCWPVASWSGIDYYGRWKALHYTVKKAYSDVLICAKMSDLVEVFILSDHNYALDGEYALEVRTFHGSLIFSKKVPVKINALQSAICFEETRKNLLNGGDPTQAYMTLKVLVHGEVASSNVYFFAPPKKLNLLPTNIDSQVAVCEDHYQIQLQSHTLVKNVHLMFDDLDGNFSDNFFDLLPYEEKTVTFPRQENSEQIPKLKVFSLIDISK